MIMPDFNELTELFIKYRDNELIPTIFEESVSLAKKWMGAQNQVSYSEFPKDFPEEVALSYMVRLYDSNLSGAPAATLFSIALGLTRRKVFGHFSDDIDSTKISLMNVDDRLLLEEFVEEQLADLPFDVRATIVFLLLYPEMFKRMQKLHRDDPYFYVGVVRLVNIRRRVELHSLLNSVPLQSQVSKVLLLSSLYSIDPKLCVLFLQMKDVGAFIEFCILFENQTLKLPRVSQLRDTLSRVSEYSTKLDEGKVVTDHQLVPFVIAAGEDKEPESENGEVRFTPVLGSFFTRAIQSLADSYNRLHERILSDLSVCSYKEIHKVYAVLSREVIAQARLFQSVVQSIGFVDTIRGVGTRLVRTKGAKR